MAFKIIKDTSYNDQIKSDHHQIIGMNIVEDNKYLQVHIGSFASNKDGSLGKKPLEAKSYEFRADNFDFSCFDLNETKKKIEEKLLKSAEWEGAEIVADKKRN